MTWQQHDQSLSFNLSHSSFLLSIVCLFQNPHTQTPENTMKLQQTYTHTQHSQTFSLHNSSSISGRKSIEENIRSLVCVGIAATPPHTFFFLKEFFPNPTKTVYHMFSANGSLSSQFKKNYLILQWKWFSLFQRKPLFSLSSSFHPCSAYPLSSNLVLLCRWWAGAIIGSLRLTLEQNVRQFKAACQSAFCTARAPKAGCRDKGRKKVPHLFMDYPATPAPFQGLNCVRAIRIWHSVNEAVASKNYCYYCDLG